MLSSATEDLMQTLRRPASLCRYSGGLCRGHGRLSCAPNTPHPRPPVSVELVATLPWPYCHTAAAGSHSWRTWEVPKQGSTHDDSVERLSIVEVVQPRFPIAATVRGWRAIGCDEGTLSTSFGEARFWNQRRPQHESDGDPYVSTPFKKSRSANCQSYGESQRCQNHKKYLTGLEVRHD